jgi:hypothetical protein
VRNSGGFISAFSLYEHVYEAVREAVGKFHEVQEPELTVLHGVGPFAVSLYRGASALGGFEADELPSGMAVREVRSETAARRFEQHVTIVGGDQITTTGPVATHGSAIATSGGVATVGNGNVVVTGKVGRDVKVKSQPGPPSDESPGSDR